MTITALRPDPRIPVSFIKMIDSPFHPVSWARANAPVDEFIVSLIEALSSFPHLESIESCQGDGQGPIWVCFHYGEYWKRPWQDLVEFVFGYLGPGLEEQIGDSARLSVGLDQTGVAVADLHIRPEALEQTVRALRQLRRDVPLP